YQSARAKCEQFDYSRFRGMTRKARKDGGLARRSYPTLESGASVARTRDGLQRPSSGDRVVDYEYHYRPNNGDHQAVKVEPGDRTLAKRRKDKPANHGSHDPEHDVEEEARALFVDDLAGDEARDQSKHNPGDNRHGERLLLAGTTSLTRANLRFKSPVKRR